MRLSRRYPGIFSGWRRGGASGVCDAIARHHTSFRRREKDRRDSSWDRGLQAVGHALGESSATMGFCCFLRSRSSLHAELALPCWLQLEETRVSERRFPTMPGARAQGEMRQEWDEGSQRNQRPLSRYSLPEGRMASILNLHDKAPPGDLNAHLAANLKARSLQPVATQAQVGNLPWFATTFPIAMTAFIELVADR